MEEQNKKNCSLHLEEANNELNMHTDSYINRKKTNLKLQQ